MILYSSDWNRFPNAIADTKTTNTSFVRIAQLYKSMGVENHLFMLSLLQPELQGVDPHDPNISESVRLKIGLECRYNPWYYMREVCRVAAQGSDKPGMLEANRGNIALYWTYLNHIDSALIQPRQTGKSVSADSLTNWVLYFGAANTSMTLLTKDDMLRRANLDRLKQMRDLLPSYLINLSKNDPDNQVEIQYSALNNRFRTMVSQNSEASALNAGRGLSTPHLQSDEGPFSNWIATALPAALAAGTAAREQAAKANRPYGNIFTTTAGRRDHRDGKFMYDLIHNGADWSEHFCDCKDQKELMDRVVKSGKSERALLNITMSHRQLGKTDEWLRKAIANAGGTRDDIERDFFNVWTSGTLASPLSVELNEAIRNSEADPVWTEITKDNYTIHWFLPRHEIEAMQSETSLIIGLDTSDAIGRDAISMVLTHVETGEVVGVCRINETNLLRYALFLVDFMVTYPGTLLIPERRSSAQGIIDTLLTHLPAKGIDPFTRIFNHVVDASADGTGDERELLTHSLHMRPSYFYDERKGRFGFVTSADSRQTLYGPVLQNAARRGGDVVRSRSLSREIRSLVVKKGRIDHSAGGHDDAVIAWLLTHWLLMYGRHLERYGIDPARVLVNVRQVGIVRDPVEDSHRARRGELMGRIDTILQQISESRDKLVIMKLEYAVRALHAQYRQIALSNDEIMSIDAMLSQAKEDRRNQSRFHRAA